MAPGTILVLFAGTEVPTPIFQETGRVSDTRSMVRTSLLTLPLLMLVACGGSSGSNDSNAQAEFLLPDVNPTSQTYNTNVSPRDYEGGVSAWYFGAAT